MPRRVIGKCVAKVVPIHSRNLRDCGADATLNVDGRILCSRHGRIALERKQAAAEQEEQDAEDIEPEEAPSVRAARELEHDVRQYLRDRLRED